MTFDGRLTGFEIPLPTERHLDDHWMGIAFAGADLVAAGPFGPYGELLRVRAFPDEEFEEQSFVRGDANGDARVDLSDSVSVLGVLFLGGVAFTCPSAADGNDDGSLDVADAIYVLAFLFQGGTPPPAPFPEAGPDPTPDALPCGRLAD